MKQQIFSSQIQLYSTNQNLSLNNFNKIFKKGSLQRFQNLNIKCQKGNKINFLCSNQNCQKGGVLCSNLECKCFKQHQQSGCSIRIFKWIINFLQKKIYKAQQFQNTIDQQIQKAIDQLSDFRQKLLKKFNQEDQFIGLSEAQKNFLNILQKGQVMNIRGYLLKEIYQEQINNQKTQKLHQIFQNKFKEQLKILQNQIKIMEQNVSNIYQNIISNSTKLNLEKEIQWNSKIIKSKQHQRRLQLFFSKNIKDVKLLYRASQNGFQSAKFHQKCNGKTNTLTIIQTQFGKIIGGFLPLQWHSLNSFSIDEKFQSFIFSLTNNHKFILKNKDKAIYGYSTYGPTFGNFDICISNLSNSNNHSYANVGNSYIHQEYQYNNNLSWQKFQGSKRSQSFQTKQYQVYQIIF